MASDVKMKILSSKEILALAVESRLMVTDGSRVYLNDLARESTVIAFAAAIESLVARRMNARAPLSKECAEECVE
jgi:hypothetical protein